MSPIKTFRKTVGITAAQLAKELGYKSEGVVFKKEAGARALKERDAHALERMSGVSWLAWLYPDQFQNPFKGGGTEKQRQEVLKNADKKYRWSA